MQKYSIFSLARNAFTNHKNWGEAWHNPDPKPEYDVIIIGAGGHGLATAYYLAKNHGITNVAVLEKGYLGGGNTGRNTTIVRANYLLPENELFYEHSLKLWEGLSQDLNFNVMFSQRGVINLAHTDAQVDAHQRRGNAMILNGADAVWLDKREVSARAPLLDISDSARFPVKGGLLQPRAGTARHDAVAWGFARSAGRAGIDIVQNCGVSGFGVRNSRINWVQTVQGKIHCAKVLITAAGASSELARLAGFELPVEMINVQAFVSEPVKPVLDKVINYNAGLAYISQTGKGELVMGGATDGYPSFARRGSFARIEDTLVRALQIFPFLSNLRLMRHWSGTADIPMDGNAIVGISPLENMYLNCGWGYAGFKATPAVGWTMAELLATDQTPDLLAPFALDRFKSGALIDDAGIGPYPWLH